jgi:hypothetical protein
MDYRTLTQIKRTIRDGMRDNAVQTSQRWTDAEILDAVRDCMELWQRGVYVPRYIEITDAEREAQQLQLPAWANRHIIALEVWHDGRWQTARKWAHDQGTGTLYLPSSWGTRGTDARVVAAWYNPPNFPRDPFEVWQDPDMNYEVTLPAGADPLPETGLVEFNYTRVWYTGPQYETQTDIYLLTDKEITYLGDGNVELDPPAYPGDWVLAVDDPNMWAHLRHTCQSYLHALPLSNATPETRDHHERQAMFHRDTADQLWRQRAQRATTTVTLGPAVF